MLRALYVKYFKEIPYFFLKKEVGKKNLILCFVRKNARLLRKT